MLLQFGFLNLAQAGLYIEETFFPVYVRVNDGENPGMGGSRTSTAAVESGLGSDFRTTIGYTFSFGMILGITYNYFNLHTTRDKVPSVREGIDRTTTKSEFGMTLGYSLGQWKFIFTYFLSGDKKMREIYTDHLSNGNSRDLDYVNTGIKGYQLTINYGLNLGSGFEIGPSLVYRSVTYERQSLVDAISPGDSYPESTLATAAIDEELRPMVTVVYRY